MVVNVKKRKAGSYRDLAYETYEINEVETLAELLSEITHAEMDRLKQSIVPETSGQPGRTDEAVVSDRARTQEDSREKEEIGKISFDLYSGKQPDFKSAIAVMEQDFTDGLFRVFFNEQECTRLDEKLEIHRENELVLIRLVMMAGRLW